MRNDLWLHFLLVCLLQFNVVWRSFDTIYKYRMHLSKKISDLLSQLYFLLSLLTFAMIITLLWNTTSKLINDSISICVFVCNKYIYLIHKITTFFNFRIIVWSLNTCSPQFKTDIVKMNVLLGHCLSFLEILDLFLLLILFIKSDWLTFCPIKSFPHYLQKLTKPSGLGNVKGCQVNWLH